MECHNNTLQPHCNVQHPNEIIQECKKAKHFILRTNDSLVDWVTNHILASLFMFDIAFIIPVFLWSADDSVKIFLALISGSWIQWWALPALQRSQNKLQLRNEAKDEADHNTLTYLANLQDRQTKEILKHTEILQDIQAQLRGIAHE